MNSAAEKPVPVATTLAINTITFADIRDSLARGASDFLKKPQFGLFFGAFYMVAGWIIMAMSFRWGMSYLAYPLAAGFILLGPFIAIGLYEVSRRLEAGQPVTWGGVLGVMYDQRRFELPWMAFVVLFIFWIWLYQVRLLMALFLGLHASADLGKLMHMILTTPDGWTFLVVGHLVGAFLSLVLFTVTVVSCPLLLDRNVDFITAIITSVKAVQQNLVPMLFWGVLVVLAMIVAIVPGFLGLLFILPILGHATWHLYRRLIRHTAA
jgi:uncharacterized membrane protein